MRNSIQSLIATALVIVWCVGFGGVSPAIEAMRFLPGDTATGPATGTQLAPAIAEGSGGYLIAWQDLRSSPDSGPPFTALGRGFDIYAQRLDSDGVPLSDPLPIAIGFGDQRAPQVAWNGENWLVAWETPCECWSYSSQVQAVRVSPAGAVLDATPIVVHTNASEWFRMTSNGSEWLVVLDSLRGIRISASGELINPAGTQMAIRSTTGRHAVVSAQGEYLLAWDSWGPATARRFSADLTPLGDPFPLPSTYIAASGQAYFVVWDEQSTYWDDYVYGRQYTTDGVPGPTLTLAGTGSALPLAYPGQMAVGWGGGNWWTAWVESERGVVFARVNSSGTVLDFGGEAVDPTSTGYFPMSTPKVAGRSTGGAQFVWQDKRADGGVYDILSAAIDAAGNPAGTPAAVSVSRRAQMFIDLAEGQNEILAVFRSDLSGDHSVVAQRLDTAGNAIDLEPIVITRNVDAGTRAGASFDGTLYLVAWETGGQVYGKRVHPSGTIVDLAPISIMQGEWVDVAGLDGTFAVVTTQQTIGEHIWQPFSMRVDGTTGGLLDPSPVVIGGSFARQPRVIAFGGRWLATWQENITHDDPVAECKAAFIEADGTTTGDFAYAYGGVPDVAAADDRAIFLWRTGTPGYDNDIVGRFISVDGVLEPGEPTIWAHEEDSTDPAVTWNGSEFVVAWTDQRNSLNYFDYRYQVYAARVELDGTVIDTDSFAFGDRAEQEIDPILASLGGRTFIAASSFRNEAGHATYRFGYMVLGDPATANRFPVAIASAAPAQGDAPLLVSFDASGSHDGDGTVVLHEWSFGDGGTSTLPSPTHTYDDPANYLAQVTVTDDQGASASNVERVLVEPVNQTPIAVPSADVTSGEPPLSVVFYARDSYDPDTGIQNWEWDFGDGWDYWGSTAYHTYYEDGTFTVTLKVHDFRGATGIGTMTITVGNPNENPVASATCSPLGGPAPLHVEFDGSDSWDLDGTIVSYSWDFGDSNQGSGPTPDHVYTAVGEYSATLTVTDDSQASATTQVNVSVLPAKFDLNPVGTVPDQESPTELPLILGKELDGSLALTWGDSCMATDTDYAVYGGPLGSYSQQTPVTCSTGGLTSVAITPDSGNAFYLVVAHDGSYEGSYGSGSSGNSRVPGPVQCLPTASLLGCE